MNREVFLHALRQRLASPVRWVLIVAFALMMAGILAWSPAGMPLSPWGAGCALVVAAGLIGQERSSGVMQLAFARPVSRPSWVLSRWAAAGVLASAWTLAPAVLGLMAHPDRSPVLLAVTAESLTECWGTVSVLALFSALLPGMVDLAGYFGVGLLAFVGLTAANFGEPTPTNLTVRHVLRFVSDQLSPQIGFGWIAAGGAVPWLDLLVWGAIVSGCLVLAIVRVNALELSYAQD